MSSSFVKIYPGFFKGSLVDAPPFARLLFLAMISDADHRGVALGTVRYWANFTSITEDQVREGLEILSSPDPESTSPDEEGRRIVPFGEGANQWRIVNYKKYYEKSREEDRKEYKKEWDRKNAESRNWRTNPSLENARPTMSDTSDRKRKETKLKETKLKETKKEKFSGAVLPVELLELEPYIDKWIAYRKSKKLPPYVKLTWESKFETFQKWGITKTIKAIEYSIENGYQGIFEPKDNKPLDKKPDEVKYRRV